MLVTLLVLYYVRPVLRSRTRRRRATSILLVAASLVTINGGPPAASGEDRFGRSSSMVTGTPEFQPNNVASAQPIRLFDEHLRLREGTSIPPTIGRVVQLGRRWAFIPADDNVSVRRELTDRDRFDPAEENGKYVVLCENQMLQRIVEAIRANQTDDRWEISGEVLEFFDQNRLLIRTIQRASTN